MGSDSWYLCSHMQGEDRQRPRISASACNCWLEGKNVYLLRDEGASGQTGSPNSCWSSWLRESAGVANTGEEGANSGKAIRASLQGGRDTFCLLATATNHNSSSLSIKICIKGTDTNMVDCVFFLWNLSILLFGRPFSSHVITSGLRPSLPNQLPLRFDVLLLLLPAYLCTFTNCNLIELHSTVAISNWESILVFNASLPLLSMLKHFLNLAVEDVNFVTRHNKMSVRRRENILTFEWEVDLY